jgi:hypothetical protein
MAKRRRANSSEYLRVARQILETKPSDMYYIDKQQSCGSTEKAGRDESQREPVECSEKNK